MMFYEEIVEGVKKELEKYDQEDLLYVLTQMSETSEVIEKVKDVFSKGIVQKLSEDASVLKYTLPTRRVLDAINGFLDFLIEGKTFVRSYYEAYGTGKTFLMNVISELSRRYVEGSLTDELKLWAEFRRSKLSRVGGHLMMSDQMEVIKDMKRGLEETLGKIPHIPIGIKLKRVVIDFSDPDVEKTVPLYKIILKKLEVKKEPKDHTEAIKYVQELTRGSKDRLVILLDELQHRYIAALERGLDVGMLGDADIEFVKGLCELDHVYIIISANETIHERTGEILHRILKKVKGSVERVDKRLIDVSVRSEMLYAFASVRGGLKFGKDFGISHKELESLYKHLEEDIEGQNVIRNLIRYVFASLSIYLFLEELRENVRFFIGLVPARYIIEGFKEYKQRDITRSLRVYEELLDVALEENEDLKPYAKALMKAVYILDIMKMPATLDDLNLRFTNKSIMSSLLQILKRKALISVTTTNRVVPVPIPAEVVELFYEFIHERSLEALTHVYAKLEAEGAKIKAPKTVEKLKEEFEKHVLKRVQDIFKDQEFPLDGIVEVQVDVGEALDRLVAKTLEEINKKIKERKNLSSREFYTDASKTLMSVYMSVLKEAHEYAHYTVRSYTGESKSVPFSDIKSIISKIKARIEEAVEEWLREKYDQGISSVPLNELIEHVGKTLKTPNYEAIRDIVLSAAEKLEFVEKVGDVIVFKREEDPEKKYKKALGKIIKKILQGKDRISVKKEVSEALEIAKKIYGKEADKKLLEDIKRRLRNAIGDEPKYYAASIRGSLSFKPLSKVESLNELKKKVIVPEEYVVKILEKTYEKRVKTAVLKEAEDLGKEISNVRIREIVEEIVDSVPEGIDREIIVSKLIYRAVEALENSGYKLEEDKRYYKKERKRAKTFITSLIVEHPEEFNKDVARIIERAKKELERLGLNVRIESRES